MLLALVLPVLVEIVPLSLDVPPLVAVRLFASELSETSATVDFEVESSFINVALAEAKRD